MPVQNCSVWENNTLKTKIYYFLMAFWAVSLSPLPAFTLDLQGLEEALLAPERDVADRIRDSARKPIAVLEFLQLEEGNRVLDLYAANGYYTYILAKAIGPAGTVYAQNAPRAASFEDNIGERSQNQALAAMVASAGLENVRPLLKPSTALDLEAASIDFVLISQILHDYYNGNPRRAKQLLQHIYEVLKPDGIVGLIDHVGLEGSDNTRMHRMTIDQARNLAKEAGFIVEEESSLLRNSQDQHKRSIFDPMLNRQTDQFLLRLRKPQDANAQ
jgi:predicted methyltransferase